MLVIFRKIVLKNANDKKMLRGKKMFRRKKKKMFSRIKDVPSDEELRDAFAGEIVKIFVSTYVTYMLSTSLFSDDIL